MSTINPAIKKKPPVKQIRFSKYIQKTKFNFIFIQDIISFNYESQAVNLSLLIPKP